jgi:hypothetical protein
MVVEKEVLVSVVKHYKRRREEREREMEERESTHVGDECGKKRTGTGREGKEG